MKKLVLALLILTIFPLTVLAHEKNSVYERILQSKTIRCGYALWPTALQKDPNTGEFSGILYDYMTALGKALNVKVEWTQETSYADYATALDTEKFDIFCASLWADGTRQHLIDYTRPYAYQAVWAWVRTEDKRFDGNIKNINDPNVKISTIDGEISEDIRKVDFPKASFVSLPQISDSAQLLLNVVNKKADVAFKSEDTVKDFLKTNPNTLRKIETDRPLRVFAEVLGIKKGEHDLRQAVNNATQALLNNGKIEKIIQNHERYPGSYLRVARPYQVGE